MDTEYYLVDDERREAFELGKGLWAQIANVCVDPTRTRKALDDAVFDAWCRWAVLTAEEYKAWPAAAARFVLHEATGFYVLRTRGGDKPYDFDADLAYVKRMADKLWTFCEGRGSLRVLNDCSDDMPWWDGPDEWWQVGTRYEEVWVKERRRL